MVDYSLIEKVYCNSAYVEHSPAAIKMLFAEYRVELVTNLEAFETAKTISGVPELIKTDNKYLVMINEILETIQKETVRNGELRLQKRLQYCRQD